MIKTKVCTKCGKELPATKEHFHKSKTGKFGLSSQCKACRNKESKKYREENKEYCEQWRAENKDYFKDYQAKNKRKIQKQKREYYKQNKEKLREYYKDWYSENKGTLRENSRQHYAENRDAIRKRRKQLYEANKEKIQEQTRNRVQKYLARKKELPATLTERQWEQIKKDFNNACAYCGVTEEKHLKEFGQTLHQEHFVPLSKGGAYTHNNIIPACMNCNSSKRDKDFFEWYPQQEFYSKEKEEKILKYLNYINDDIQQLSIL